MSNIADSIFYFHNYFTNKGKSSGKTMTRHARAFPAASLHTAFHCQTACARLVSPNPKTQVTWGRGRLRACAPQADGDYPAPAELGLGPR